MDTVERDLQKQAMAMVVVMEDMEVTEVDMEATEVDMEATEVVMGDTVDTA